MRDSAVGEPLWALGAAVLLLEDLPMDDLARDAAELAVAHWPSGLDLGRGTTEKLVRRMTEYAGADRVTALLLDRSEAGGSAAMATELALLGPLRDALADPASFARLGDRLPESLPGCSLQGPMSWPRSWARRSAGSAWPGPTRPCALLRIAALMDGRNGPPADRERAVDLARSLLLPTFSIRTPTRRRRAGRRSRGGCGTSWLPTWCRRSISAGRARSRTVPGPTHRWLGRSRSRAAS